MWMPTVSSFYEIFSTFSILEETLVFYHYQHVWETSCEAKIILLNIFLGFSVEFSFFIAPMINILSISTFF